MNPPIGSETTFPLTKLDHCFAENPNEMPRPLQKDQDTVLIMAKGELGVRDHSGTVHNVPAGSACYVPSALVTGTILTFPGSRGEGECIYLNLEATSTGERPLTVLSDAAKIPLYEDDELQERRYLGKWAAIETGDACSVSIISFKRKGNFNIDTSGKIVILLVLDGWVRSSDGLVMQNQIYFPERSLSIEVSKGSRFLFVTGARRPHF